MYKFHTIGINLAATKYKIAISNSIIGNVATENISFSEVDKKTRDALQKTIFQFGEADIRKKLTDY